MSSYLVLVTLAFARDRAARVKAESTPGSVTTAKISRVEIAVEGRNKPHGAIYNPLHGHLATFGLRKIYRFAFPKIGKIIETLRLFTNWNLVYLSPPLMQKALRAYAEEQTKQAGDGGGSEEDNIPQALPSFTEQEGGSEADASLMGGGVDRTSRDQKAMFEAFEEVDWDDGVEFEGGGRMKKGKRMEEEEQESEGRATSKQLPAPMSEDLPASPTFALWEGGPVVEKGISDQEVERLFQDAMRRAVESVDWDDEEDDIGPLAPASLGAVEKHHLPHSGEEGYQPPVPASNTTLAAPAPSQFVEEMPVGKPLSYIEIHGGSKLRVIENYDDWSSEEGESDYCPLALINSYADEPPTDAPLPPASPELALEYQERKSEVITDMYLRMKHWWEKESYMTVHKAARIRSAFYAEFWEGHDPYRL